MKKPIPRKKAPPVRVALTSFDKLVISAVLFLLFVVPPWFMHSRAVHGQRASISKTLQGWKTTYHINDQQAERIKQIEFDFHGSGSPFSIKPAHTGDEKNRHHEEISSLMAPDDAERFMKVMEQSHGKH